MSEEIYGELQTEVGLGEEGLFLTFSPGSHTLKDRWRNNGLSANFLGDYFATFFPRDDPKRQTEIRAAVSYVANELLENAMKYCSGRPGELVHLRLCLGEAGIMLTLENAASAAVVARLRGFLVEFLAADATDYLVMQMERSALESSVSGLGFATMTNDYGAILGWRLKDLGDDRVGVTTQVLLNF
jgi:hypothetical protein